jgi:hypothetical protein
MSIESALFTALTNHAGLSGLIAARLHPDYLPQGAVYPCVVMQRVSTPRSQVFGSTQAVAVSRPRFQFSCWALTHEGARAVCAALRTALLATSYPVTLDSEYTLHDPDSNYSRRNLDAFVGHSGE